MSAEEPAGGRGPRSARLGLRRLPPTRAAVARLSGSTPPSRRLPVTPEALGRLLRRPSASFPWTKPPWPSGVERPPVLPRLGTAYDTQWARRYPARFARVLLTELVARPVLAAIAAPTVEGLDRIDHLEGPVIFAANHASHLDAPLLVSALPERWRHRVVVAGAADYFFDTRAKALAFALAVNAVPIERQRPSRDSANHLATLLSQGWSLLIFPEGGRSPDGWAQPHRAGAAWLSVRTGRPLVPVHLEGTGRILPRGSRTLRPGATQVTFGRPLSGEDTRQLAEELEAAIAALADEQASGWWAAARRAASGTTPPPTGPAAAAWRRSWALGEPGPLRKRRRSTDQSERWPRL